MQALEKIKEISTFLEKCGIDDAHKESEIILIYSLGIDKTALYRDDPILSEKDLREIDKIIERRAKREPLQYILGYVEFYGLKIKVGEGVLIPRPETELMVEEIIKLFTVHRSLFTVLDLCTGSGCLALAIAKHFPDAKVYGTDISEEAVRYASENAEMNGIRNVTFLRGSLFEPIKKLFTVHYSLFTVIISNPPYIKSNDIADLQPEIKNWEPLNALNGGDDGLRYYREILAEAPKYLAMDGFVFLEVGEGQAGDVIKIAEDANFRKISVIKDYAGIDRILAITR